MGSWRFNASEGWVERSETHRDINGATLNPSYGLHPRYRCDGFTAAARNAAYRSVAPFGPK
jgi:hypothetical protein